MKFPWGKQKKAIEDPYKLTTNKDGIMISVIRKDYRPFYDTTWSVNVVVERNNHTAQHSFDVVRDDAETAEHLENVIRNLDLGNLNRSQLFYSLDCKRHIYYD